MAEPTLAVTHTSLTTDVAFFLYGKATDDLSDDEAARVAAVIKAGYRQFLYPPAFDGIEPGYEWSFLRPTTTLTTTADDADQDLPMDFDRLIDGFSFAANSQVPPVQADVGEGHIRRLREAMSETGRPRVAGIRTKAGTGTASQLKEVMFYPTPNSAYVLSYRYQALVNELTDTNLYPVGGMKHGETLTLSCLAKADSMINDRVGAKHEEFVRSLISSIATDKKEGTKFFGPMNNGAVGDGYYDYTLTISGNVMQA